MSVSTSLRFKGSLTGLGNYRLEYFISLLSDSYFSFVFQKSYSSTHRHSFKRAGVEGSVNLSSDFLVVVVKVLQCPAFVPQRGHRFIEGQCESPYSIIRQRSFLKSTRFFRILPPETWHQLGLELLGGLWRDFIDSSTKASSNVKVFVRISHSPGWRHRGQSPGLAWRFQWWRALPRLPSCSPLCNWWLDLWS